MASIILTEIIINNEITRSLRKQRIFKDRFNPFDLTDQEMIRYTRFNRETYKYIIEMCEKVKPKNKAGHSIPLHLKVMLFRLEII